jgi:hypothetical protein
MADELDTGTLVLSFEPARDRYEQLQRGTR